MELSKVIKERRSVRHYNNKNLTKSTIEDILNFAILSPSAHNRQPWYFVVIQNQSMKEEISQMLLDEGKEAVKMTCDCLKNAQALVLVFANITEELMDVVSVGASIENMLLRARDLDVASLWVGYILKIEKALQQKFALNKKLIGAVCLGYTDHFPSPRPRKTLDEVSAWY